MVCGLTPAYAQGADGLRDSLSKATEALAYHPDSVDLRLKKVGWNIELKQWQYAKDDLDKVLYLQPENIAGLFFRAYVNERLNRYKFARMDYENLLRLVPGNFEGRLGLALLNQKDRHYTEAMDQINLLVESYPNSDVAIAARAGIEKEREMYELAEYDYSIAHQLDPSNIDYLMNLVDVRLKLKKKDEVIAALVELHKLGVPQSGLKFYYSKVHNL